MNEFPLICFYFIFHWLGISVVCMSLNYNFLIIQLLLLMEDKDETLDKSSFTYIDYKKFQLTSSK